MDSPIGMDIVAGGMQQRHDEVMLQQPPSIKENSLTKLLVRAQWPRPAPAHPWRIRA